MGRLHSLVATPTRLFWLLQTVGWTAYGLEHFLGGIGMGKPLSYGWLSFYDSLLGFALTLLLRYVFRHTWTWPLRSRVITGCMMLVATSIFYGLVYAAVVYRLCADCKAPTSLLGYIYFAFGAIYLLLAWSGLYFGIKFGRQLRHEKEATLKANAMAYQAQLKMLRYQLNPHFLFNTLNAISTLVLDGKQDEANRMVGALSSFLRYSLHSDPEQRVTLAEEIESLRLYLGIEQVRFGERLRVEFDVGAEATQALVPSLILQPLIENAIKYAVARREEGGSISIGAHEAGGRLDIHVRDDGPGSSDYRAKSASGHGVGLANTRERLRVLFGDRQSFTIGRLAPHGTEVHIVLPLERAAPVAPAATVAASLA